MKRKRTARPDAMLGGVLIFLLAGCTPPPPASPLPVVRRVMSPVETARTMHQLHARRDYDALAQWIIPESRQATLQLIRAVDSVVMVSHAIEQLCERVYSGPIGESFRLSAMENNLGIFSKDVTYFSQSFTGNRAVVTLQEWTHVPLVNAEFRYRDGRWLYSPEQTPEMLPRELDELAGILRALFEDIRRGENLLTFLDAYMQRVTPQVQKIMNTQLPARFAAGPEAAP